MRTALVLMTASLLLVSAGSAAAQMEVLVGAGALVPVARFADVATSGPLGVAGVLVGVRDGVFLGAQGFYGRAGHLIRGDRSDVYGGSALVAWSLYRTESVSVRIAAGLGGAVHALRSQTFPGLNTSRTGLIASVAALVTTAVGGVTPFFEGGYARGFGDLDTAPFPTEMSTVALGLAIPLG
jgi:hypothetical protein